MKILGIENYVKTYYDSNTGEKKTSESVILHLSNTFQPEATGCIGDKVLSVYVKKEYLPKVNEFSDYINYLGRECYIAVREFQGKLYSAAAVQII